MVHLPNKQEILLLGVWNSSVDWGDYDNDGDLDILLAGSRKPGTSSQYNTKVYRNNGDNSFTENADSYLQGMYFGSVEWGDYDNDGDLDILASGQVGFNEYATSIYKNNGDRTFHPSNRYRSDRSRIG